MKLRAPSTMTWEIPMLCVLFCFAISLFNLAGYIFAAVVVCMLVIRFTKISLGGMELLLLLFSLSYSVIYFIHNSIDINGIIWYVIGPWAAYLYGRLFIEKATIPHAFMAFIAVLAMGMFMHGLLNLIAYIRSDHVTSYAFFRRSVDFWRGTVVNVNTTGMYCTFAVGLGVGVLFSRVSKPVKALCFGIIVLSAALSVFFANRTLLMIIGGLVAWQLIRVFASADVCRKKKISMVIALVGVVLLVAIVLGFNIGGAGDWYDSLKVVKRFRDEGVSNRFIVWSYFFEDGLFLSHPFGGGQMLKAADVSYFHNMWLDVYHAAGFIPFLLLAVITFKAVVSTIRSCRIMKQNGYPTSATVYQCVMVAAALNCAIEPIIEANPYFFLTIMMFLGAGNGFCRQVTARHKGEVR